MVFTTHAEPDPIDLRALAVGMETAQQTLRVCVSSVRFHWALGERSVEGSVMSNGRGVSVLLTLSKPALSEA